MHRGSARCKRSCVCVVCGVVWWVAIVKGRVRGPGGRCCRRERRFDDGVGLLFVFDFDGGQDLVRLLNRGDRRPFDGEWN